MPGCQVKWCIWSEILHALNKLSYLVGLRQAIRSQGLAVLMVRLRTLQRAHRHGHQMALRTLNSGRGRRLSDDPYRAYGGLWGLARLRRMIEPRAPVATEVSR